VEAIDYIIVIAGWAIANVVFNNFEKHLPLWRRVGKFAILLLILSVIGFLFGRYAFYGAIALLTVGQIVLHGWWFPRHGINGLSAEPYDKYLALINEVKGGAKQHSR
jgi:hypothetical protein